MRPTFGIGKVCTQFANFCCCAAGKVARVEERHLQVCNLNTGVMNLGAKIFKKLVYSSDVVLVFECANLGKQ